VLPYIRLISWAEPVGDWIIVIQSGVGDDVASSSIFFRPLSIIIPVIARTYVCRFLFKIQYIGQVHTAAAMEILPQGKVAGVDFLIFPHISLPSNIISHLMLVQYTSWPGLKSKSPAKDRPYNTGINSNVWQIRQKPLLN